MTQGDPGERRVPPRMHGVAHLIASASYSLSGAQRLWREAAFRQELLAFAVLFCLYLGLGVTPGVLVGFVVLSCLLFATEALNTAIEELVDRVSPEWSHMGRHAKDLGSFAVMCVLVAQGVLLAWVVWQAMTA